MTRDYKLILGGALCCGGGCYIGLGAWSLGVALVFIGQLLLVRTGRG